MGKPPSPDLPRPGGDDALSLHTQHSAVDIDGYIDDDAPELIGDDLPPLYDEASASSAPLLTPGPSFMVPQYKRDETTGVEYYLDSRLDTDPKLLEEHILWWAALPPRPYVRILGTHRQTVNNGGKKENKTVVDFDVRVELTPYLYSDATRRLSWRELRTVENADKAYRGTVLRSRDPSATKGIQLSAHKPSLAEWCHRYCAKHAGLKRFTLRRKMVGFEEHRVRQKLDSLIRSTNYRGAICISVPVMDEAVEVYNECKTNEWRLTTWIFWLCVLTATFLFTWPYLFFRTKRFEVLVAEWSFSKPTTDGDRKFVSIDEAQWYNMWGRAINRAVLEKRQCTLGQQELFLSEGAPPTFDSGSENTAVAFVRAGVNAMNEVNRQLGWGYDS